MSNADLLADAIDTLITLGWAFAGWLAVIAAVGTIVVLTAGATGAWAVKALWRRAAGPSWRRGRLRARILARHRLKRPSSRTTDPHYEEAA